MQNMLSLSLSLSLLLTVLFFFFFFFFLFFPALMAASMRGQLEAVRLLLQVEGCDVQFSDSKGMTAKALANARKHDDIVSEIQKWLFKNNEGEEPEVKIDQPIGDSDSSGGTSSGGWFSSWFGESEGEVEPEM
jgi:hypothetical protein